MKHRAYISRDWNGGHRLILVEDRPGARVGVVSDFIHDEYQEGDMFDSCAGIGRADEMIQAIVDRAWEAGFRPSGFGDVKNETTALREHLADMKSIAFHKLGIKP